MRVSKLSNESGSAVLIVLLSTILVGVTLGSYLHLVSNQNLSVMRSLAWNSAVAVAEAGIEEAMAHLNRNGTNRISDGWTAEGTNVVKERVMADAKYKVYLPIAMEPPIITAEAFVRNPRDGQYLSSPRVFRTSTTNDALFSKGMIAKGQIDLSGNNIKTDSFDSSDPNYSGSGGVYDPAKTKDNGDIATNSSLVNSLSVGNADIYGRVSTGPGGTVSVGPNGGVGDKAWHNSGKKGIKPNWAKDDMNVQFPDVEPPFVSGSAPQANANYGGTNYTYLVSSGDYEMSSLSMSGNNKILAVTGHAKLYVTGNVSLSGKAFIYIAPGASLQLYVGGSSASLAGNGVMNANASALSFGYWGLNSNTSLSFGGNAAFTGTIYAPYAAFHLGGGGNNTYDFVGASITSTVKMNGHFNFHYDEALRKFGVTRGYIITSWNEVTAM